MRRIDRAATAVASELYGGGRFDGVAIGVGRGPLICVDIIAHQKTQNKNKTHKKKGKKKVSLTLNLEIRSLRRVQKQRA